jgi:hypothetical protein
LKAITIEIENSKKSATMTITEFRDKLVTELSNVSMPKRVRNEKDFEKHFVVPVVQGISSQSKEIRIFTHPWGRKIRCMPDCETAPTDGQVVVGCWRCWKESKNWASVATFGTHHDFDLMARDASGRVLAIEVKLVDVKGRRMPNGEIQRFIGQCFLASTKHDAVIGLCGYRGSLNPKYEHDTSTVKGWLERSRISLIFRSVG